MKIATAMNSTPATVAAAASAAQINVVTTPRSSTRSVANRFWITVAPYAALASPGCAEQKADTGDHCECRVRAPLERILDRVTEGVGDVAKRVDGLPAGRLGVGNRRIHLRLGAAHL